MSMLTPEPQSDYSEHVNHGDGKVDRIEFDAGRWGRIGVREVLPGHFQLYREAHGNIDQFHIVGRGNFRSLANAMLKLAEQRTGQY